MDHARTPYSSHAVAEEGQRFRKADKIVSVLSRHVSLRASDLLDIGTGSGHIANRLSRHARSVKSVNVSDERVVDEGYEFIRVDDHRLPFADGSFDAVVSNQVIEHMPFQHEHLSEIARVLRSGGVAYLATPNRFAVIEPHFKLPFLSWLPRTAADLLTRTLRGAPWDVHPLSARDVRDLTRTMFDMTDVTIDMLRDPAGHALDLVPSFHAVFRRVPRWLYKLLYSLMPSYVWVLTKR